MSLFFRMLGFLISYELFIYSLTVTMFWGAIAIRLFGLSFWDAAGFAPSKFFLAVLFINRTAGLINEIYKKSKVALLTAGILTVISGFSLDYLYRFEGKAGLGEGEIFSGYERIEKGPMGRVRQIPFRIRMGNIKGEPFRLDEKAGVELFTEKAKRIYIALGRHEALSPGLEAGVSSVGIAPRVLIMDTAGKMLNSTFVKLSLYPAGMQDYFLVTPLPHRFYVSLTGREDKPLSLKILRGKLILIRKEIALGEEVEFDGLKVSFPETVKWAGINVRYYPGRKFIYIGLGLIVLGILMLVRTKK